jgi:TRAP transporter 4TM/12TM fusion protein
VDPIAETQQPDAPPAQPAVRIFVQALGGTMLLLSVAWALDLYRLFNFLPWSEQFLLTMLGLSLVMVFLHVPAKRGTLRRRVPWYDWIAATVGGGVCAYATIYYPRLGDLYMEQPTDAVIIGVSLMVLSAEGLRRTVGTVLFAIFVMFIFMGLFADRMPVLTGLPTEFPRMTAYLAFDMNSLTGVPLRVVTSIVIAFVFMGNVLLRSGGTEFFTDISVATMGRYRGGSAKIAVTASGLFGSISGSTVSNVVSTGVITIPLMRKGGYQVHSAAAIEAVASTGGQMMPPVMGAAAFVMAEMLEVAYAEVVVAAIVPSLLFYAGLFFQADLEAARYGIVRVDQSLIPRVGKVMRQGWIFVLPFVALIYTLFWLNWPPEMSGLAAAAIIIVLGLGVGYKGRRMSLKELGLALVGTGIGMLDIMMIAAAAGMIIGILFSSGLAFSLTDNMALLGEGNLFLLLILAAFVCILLGMGMPTIGVYILLATLVAPSMIKVGIPPMAAHLYVLYFGMMSMITPPIAIAAFAAANVAGCDPMRTALSAVRFGWSAFVVPFMFVFAPSLLLQGPVALILLTVSTAFVGVWLVSIGIMGYLFRDVTVPFRLAFVAAGLALMVPAESFTGAFWTDIAGFVVGVILVGREIRARRGNAAQASVAGAGAN